MARGLPTGGQGSKVNVLCAEPKEHKRFRPGTRPGGIGFPAGRIGDRGDREIVYVPNVYVPFPAPRKKPININFFEGTVFGTNRNHPWAKQDQSLGQTGTSLWDKPAVFC